MSALADVLDYAARGWQVFPLKPQSKEPATRRGFYDATTNPATLQRWFADFAYNIAIRTGTPSNVFVLDIDGDAGFATLAEIESVQGRLPLRRPCFPAPATDGIIGLSPKIRFRAAPPRSARASM